MPSEFKINLNDKPLLSKALLDNPKLAKEVIGTFVGLMEEAFDKGWATVAAEFHKDLSFTDLIRGILRGSLDLPALNPEAYDALKMEVHPLALLSPRKNYLDGGTKVYNWRQHFQLPVGTTVSEESVSLIFRKLLRYGKYVNIEQLAKALESNQLTTFRGLGERSVELLPMIPALKHQRKIHGELGVGRFFDDIGFLDGGTGQFAEGATCCPSCTHDALKDIGAYKACLNCNIAFKL